MQNKPTIVIAAISSRPYVKAAKEAGFDVIAIDVYVDQDTQAMAKQSIQVPCFQNQFHAELLLAAIDGLDHQAIQGFCYGAGFEAQPELIEQIQQRMPVLGNTGNVIEHCKSPQAFAQFCQHNQFATPLITLEAPTNLEGWLIKTAGGCGGTHVHFAESYTLPVTHDQYYQRFQSGLSISCLFLAAGGTARIVGVNEQWVAADVGLPFLYGGAVSHHQLEEKLLAELTRFIALATVHFQLTGLNSVDALLDVNALQASNQLVFLEINPRLSATMDLYATEADPLFAFHVQAFQSHSSPALNVIHQSKAHHIVYARQVTHIQAPQSWPDWVCDIPSKPQTFDIGMPICTVISEADTMHAAKQLVQARAASLLQ